MGPVALVTLAHSRWQVRASLFLLLREALMDRSSAKVERDGNVTIITLSDAGYRGDNTLARQLTGQTDAAGAEHMLLDFTNVEFLTSAELGTLVTLHKRLKACGGRLTLFNLNAQVYEVFAITNLHRLLGICREKGADAVRTQSENSFEGHHEVRIGS